MTTPKKCEVCRGPIVRQRGAGRVHEYRTGVVLPVPDDFEIPTCSKCGEIHLSEQDYAALEEAQRPAFIAWQKRHVGELVDAIKASNPGVRLRDIERACDVTATYLSHVLGGRNAAGQTLLNLLEAFALYPAEFQRQLAGKMPWQQARTRPAGKAAYEGRFASRTQARLVPVPAKYTPPKIVDDADVQVEELLTSAGGM